MNQLFFQKEIFLKSELYFGLFKNLLKTALAKRSIKMCKYKSVSIYFYLLLFHHIKEIQYKRYCLNCLIN